MPESFNDSTGWTRFDYSAPDGLLLAGRKYGWENPDASRALPVICLAGLTRNSADFHELAMYFAHADKAPRRVLCLDYRGRGMSARDPNRANYNPLTEADDVIAGAVAADIGHAAIIGVSRGGMIAMILAAMRPGLMRAVVLNDVGPEIGVRGILRIRGYIGRSRDHANWSGAISAMREAGQSQFPAFGDADWDRHARLIHEEKDGRIVRRYDPALARTLASVRIDHPLPSLWPQFAGLRKLPVLLIRGEKSELLESGTVAKMQAVHPGMETTLVPNQGHAPDLGMLGLPQLISAFVEKADV